MRPFGTLCVLNKNTYLMKTIFRCVHERKAIVIVLVSPQNNVAVSLLQVNPRVDDLALTNNIPKAKCTNCAERKIKFALVVWIEGSLHLVT